MGTGAILRRRFGNSGIKANSIDKRQTKFHGISRCLQDLAKELATQFSSENVFAKVGEKLASLI